MIKHYFLPAIICCTIFNAIQADTGVAYQPINHDCFDRGEVLNYKVSFGMFSVGKATMKVQKKAYRFSGRDCYKVDAIGKTSGLVGWVANVDNNWGAYIDAKALVPHMAYREIKENKYRKSEVLIFNHQNNKVETKVMNNKTGQYKPSKHYDAPDNIRDLMGGYLYLRTVNYNKMHKGDTVVVDGFFEDTVYQLKVVYQGKEKVKTKAGKFRAIKLVPVVPNNKLFDGKNAVTVWLSDDANKIPIKVKADMFIGNASIELSTYNGIKHRLNKL